VQNCFFSSIVQDFTTLISLFESMNQRSGTYIMVTTTDRIKLVIGTLQTAKEVSKFLPIIVFSYSGLTLFFAVLDFFEHNIVAGIILSILAGLGIFLAIRIFQTRRRGRNRKYANLGTR
jgi:hypothetical protein